MASYLILLFKLNSKLFDNLGTNQYFRIRQCMKFERVDILLAIYDHKMAVWNKYRGILKNPPLHEKFLDILNKNELRITLNA